MAVLANAHPTSSCSAPASQGITSFACRAFFLLCNLSLSGVIWSLLSTWGAIPPFPSSSALSHGKMVSLYPAKAKTIKFFCPFLVFLVVQHDPHSIPGLLSHISGAKFPCWSPGLPMPTYLSSTLQLWGSSLDSSLPVTLQVIGILESSLMDSSKQFPAFMGFHLGLASLPAHQLLLAKLPLCPFCIGHSMCHNKYEV